MSELDPSALSGSRASASSIDESLEALYHEAPCGYLSSLPDGTLVSVNRTFLEWTGYTESDLLGGRRLQDLLTPGGRIYHETHYAPMLRMQGAVREVALDVICADGRELPVLMNSVLRSDAERPIVRTVVIDATERRRYEQELVRAKRSAEDAEARARILARTLQASLMPPALPELSGVQVASSYRPAGDGTEVGGDFYDMFSLGALGWGLVIGDVEGKGAEAATVTALARYTVRAAAVQDPSPAAVLGTLNRALLLDPATRFCTLAYAIVQPAASDGSVSVSFASAGHPLPVHVPAAGEPVQVGRPGTLAGAFAEDFRVEETTIHLAPGDVLVLFTDGLAEARSDGAFLGEEFIQSALLRLRGESPSVIAESLTEEAVRFQQGAAHDDIAVIALRVGRDG